MTSRPWAGCAGPSCWCSIAGLVACAGESGSEPADPAVLGPGVTQATVAGEARASPSISTVASPRHRAAGGGRVPTSAVPTAPPPGRRCRASARSSSRSARSTARSWTWCLLLAETPAQTQRGLMEVTDPEPRRLRRDAVPLRQPRRRRLLHAQHPAAAVDRLPRPPTARSSPSSGWNHARMSTAARPTRPTDRSSERSRCRWRAGGVASLGIEPGAVVVDTGRPCAA